MGNVFFVGIFVAVVFGLGLGVLSLVIKKRRRDGISVSVKDESNKVAATPFLSKEKKIKVSSGE